MNLRPNDIRWLHVYVWRPAFFAAVRQLRTPLSASLYADSVVAHYRTCLTEQLDAADPESVPHWKSSTPNPTNPESH